MFWGQIDSIPNNFLLLHIRSPQLRCIFNAYSIVVSLLMVAALAKQSKRRQQTTTTKHHNRSVVVGMCATVYRWHFLCASFLSFCCTIARNCTGLDVGTIEWTFISTFNSIQSINEARPALGQNQWENRTVYFYLFRGISIECGQYMKIKTANSVTKMWAFFFLQWQNFIEIAINSPHVATLTLLLLLKSRFKVQINTKCGVRKSVTVTIWSSLSNIYDAATLAWPCS